MSFTKSKAIEQTILDTLAPRRSDVPIALRESSPGWVRLPWVGDIALMGHGMVPSHGVNYE